ncbi:MAG TPA: murein biosynthesis integral membrane protein MurJ [Acidimicrobiales bacterium]|nr:murein biosynthesis integral membrane protein MurJ [Acidimicrobiales bacterium]
MRAAPNAYDTELHYGESNRRRASQFLGLSENAVADRPGRRWARAASDPDHSRFAPEDLTGELPIAADMFGLAPESPGIAQQPLAPWMTGEHQAVSLDAPPWADARERTAPPVAPDREPAPGSSIFPPGTPAPPDPSGPDVADLDDPDAPPGTGTWDRGAYGVPDAAVEAAAEPPAAPPAVPGEAEAPPPSSSRGSMLVAAGILLSRCAGLIRTVVIGAVLGTGPAADAFNAALRIPNLMQNLLGEGVLSASFIPVYARLRAEGRDEEAGRLAGAIAGLLAALTGVISVLGVVLADPLTRVLVGGFDEYRHELTVELTRIMFPGIGFLVLSAWCLGVLNSHKRFFLSYVAPVLWNVAQIAALLAGVLVIGGHTSLDDQWDLAVVLSWGVLIGGILQFGVQIVPVRRLLGTVRLSLDTKAAPVRSVIGRFVPVVIGRGAIQIMGWVDLWLASFLVSGAPSLLFYTMVLYLLPVSLFGVSVAAAELPDMSQVSVHDPETRRRFRLRLEDSMARIGWYVAFTATMFIVVGDVIVAAIFEHGAFTHSDTVAVWLTLAVLAVGLLPATATRLLQNGLYALDDPRTPARLGVLGVVLSAVIGVAFMFPFDRLIVGPEGIEGWGDFWAVGPLPAAVRENVDEVRHLGIIGLAIGASVSRWIEYRMLSRALAWRVGRTKLAGRWLGPIAIGCAASATVAFFTQMVFAPLPSIVEAALVLGPAGLTYMLVTRRLGVPEALATANRLAAMRRRVRR